MCGGADDQHGTHGEKGLLEEVGYGVTMAGGAQGVQGVIALQKA